MLTVAESPGAWSAQPFLLGIRELWIQILLSLQILYVQEQVTSPETQVFYLQNGHCVSDLPGTSEIMSRKHLVCAICQGAQCVCLASSCPLAWAAGLQLVLGVWVLLAPSCLVPY